MEAKIISAKAREVLDSRGNPTVDCSLGTKKNSVIAIVPSGASTGAYEACEMRDADKKRYNGKGVLKAVENINKKIKPKILGRSALEQKELDSLLIELDGTENKTNLGANALLAVSMACCRLAAMEKGIPLFKHLAFLAKNKNLSLPSPQMNVINSGKHIGLEKGDIQEHMIVPAKFDSFADSLRAGVETYNCLKNFLKKRFGAKSTLLGDEGGFSPEIEKIEERLELMCSAIKEAGYEGKIMLGLDSAATEFFSGNSYSIQEKEFSPNELIDFYSALIEKFPIISIEDGFAEDDWSTWIEFSKECGKKIDIIGDDLLTTNIERIKKAIKEKACNSLLLKPNQIGTVTEAISAAQLAQKNNWKVVVSHRSGETEDSFIADLAVGLGAEFSKFGAPARSERTAKYNQLLRIEEELKNLKK